MFTQFVISYLHKNPPPPDCCYFLGDNRDSTSSLFKFRGMNSMSIPSPLSVPHTGGFFTRVSQSEAKFFFVFPSSSCKHYSFYQQHTRSWHFAHKERFACLQFLQYSQLLSIAIPSSSAQPHMITAKTQ
jgi:hypothetical protein